MSPYTITWYICAVYIQKYMSWGGKCFTSREGARVLMGKQNHYIFVTMKINYSWKICLTWMFTRSVTQGGLIIFEKGVNKVRKMNFPNFPSKNKENFSWKFSCYSSLTIKIRLFFFGKSTYDFSRDNNSKGEWIKGKVV